MTLAKTSKAILARRSMTRMAWALSADPAGLTARARPEAHAANLAGEARHALIGLGHVRSASAVKG
jgi:hypothetical protein